MSSIAKKWCYSIKAKEAPAEKRPNISDDCPEAFQWSRLGLSFEIVCASCISYIPFLRVSNWGVGYFGKVARWGDSWPGLQASWECSYAVRAWVFLRFGTGMFKLEASLRWQGGLGKCSLWGCMLLFSSTLALCGKLWHYVKVHSWHLRTTPS